MGSVPVQLLIVSSIALDTTCDTMGNILKAMTRKDKASRQQKTNTDMYIKASHSGTCKQGRSCKESTSMRSSSKLQQ